MAKDATLNIRLEPTLKQHGAEVLQREGLTVTEAVRALYLYLEANQKFPDELRNANHDQQSRADRRRELMHSMVGILPADASIAEAKETRLAHHGL